MDIKIIQKYQNKSISALKKTAELYFNRFIRIRDKNQPCISCGEYRKLEAGHFYSGGNVPSLKFVENNVHGQCKQCNYFEHGKQLEYRKKLIKKIGIEKVEELEFLAYRHKQIGYKWDRFFLIEIIEIYKKKCKNLN